MLNGVGRVDVSVGLKARGSDCLVDAERVSVADQRMPPHWLHLVAFRVRLRS